MGKKYNVLLVDDDETTNFYNNYLLKSSNYFEGVYEALNGQEGLDKIAELAKSNIYIDLILLDINMPYMDGFEFLDEYNNLTNNLRSKSIVCMLTSSSHNTDLQKAEDYPVIDGYLEKPLSKEKIDRLVKMFIDK